MANKWAKKLPFLDDRKIHEFTCFPGQYLGLDEKGVRSKTQER